MITRISGWLLGKVNRRKHASSHGKAKEVLITKDEYSKLVRETVTEKDGICIYCGGVMDFPLRVGAGSPSSDRILNGDSPYTLSNVRVTHERCNKHERYVRKSGACKEDYIKTLESFDGEWINPKSEKGKLVIKRNLWYIDASNEEQILLEKEIENERQENMNTQKKGMITLKRGESEFIGCPEDVIAIHRLLEKTTITLNSGTNTQEIPRRKYKEKTDTSPMMKWVSSLSVGTEFLNTDLQTYCELNGIYPEKSSKEKYQTVYDFLRNNAGENLCINIGSLKWKRVQSTINKTTETNTSVV